PKRFRSWWVWSCAIRSRQTPVYSCPQQRFYRQKRRRRSWRQSKILSPTCRRRLWVAMPLGRRGLRVRSEMDAAEALRLAQAAGVILWVEGGSLRFRAPAGKLSPQVAEALRACRADIISYLTEEARSHFTFGPLAETQRGLWLLHQLSPDSPAYNVAFVARVHGDFNIDVFTRTIQTLLDRHESLRTTYVLREGVPVRRVAGYSPAAVRVFDVRAQSGDDLPIRIRAAYEEPFNLSTGPVLRADVFQEADDKHVLLLTAHHIAVDGISIYVLLEELFDIYSAIVTGRATPAVRNGATYSEFVTWHTQAIEAARTSREYWKAVLTPSPPILELPILGARPRTPRMRGASLITTLEPALADA